MPLSVGIGQGTCAPQPRSSATSKSLPLAQKWVAPRQYSIYAYAVFKQVLINLIGNSLKFTYTGSIVVHASVKRNMSRNLNYTLNKFNINFIKPFIPVLICLITNLHAKIRNTLNFSISLRFEATYLILTSSDQLPENNLLITSFIVAPPIQIGNNYILIRQRQRLEVPSEFSYYFLINEAFIPLKILIFLIKRKYLRIQAFFHPQITVCDSGIGIKQKDRETIFKMFGKLESTEHMNTSGVGLGVSICKKIIEGLGGELKLTQKCKSKYCLSQHGKNTDTRQLQNGSTGSTFMFTYL